MRCVCVCVCVCYIHNKCLHIQTLQQYRREQNLKKILTRFYDFILTVEINMMHM
jgi:hypothetical protein